MKRILFIRSDRFGEFLCSLPAVKLLRMNHPKSKIYLLAQKQNIALVKDVDFIDYFLEYKESSFCGYRGALRLAKILQKEEIDCVVVANAKKEFHLASLLAKVPMRIGYDRKWGFCLNNKIKDSKVFAQKHEVEYNIDLVKVICNEVNIPEITVPVDNHDELSHLREEIDLEKDYIVVHPFSSDRSKRIDESFWRILAADLRQRLKRDIVIIGSIEDRNEAVRYKKLWQARDLSGKMSLRNLAAFLKYNCFLFVGLDSGPMHLAAFLNVPVVGLFKTSAPARWKPFSNKALMIKGVITEDFTRQIRKIITFSEKERDSVCRQKAV